MGIRDSIIRWAGKSDFVRDFMSSAFPDLTRVGGISAQLALPGLDRPTENIPMAMRAFKARVSAIQQGRLRISDGDDNIIEAGDLHDLLCRKPNQRQHSKAFIGQLEGTNTLWDMMVFAKIGAAGANPDELVPLTPQFLIPIRGVHQPTGTLVPVQWLYIDPWTGQSRMFLPEDLVIANGYNPHSPLAGLSPLAAGRRVMQFSIGSLESNLGIFLHGGVPDVAWVTDKNLTKQQADEIFARLQDKFAGYMNSHKPMIAYNGIKPEKLGFSPTEMQFLEGMRMSDEQILMCFGVMPAMVGKLTGETGLTQGSSTDEQWIQWWQNTGLSELDLIAMMLQEGVADQFSWRARTARKMDHRERHAFRSYRSRVEGKLAAKGEFFVWFDDGAIPALAKFRQGKIEQHIKLCTQAGYRPDDSRDYLDLGLPDHPTNQGLIGLSVQPVDSFTNPAPVAEPVRKASPGEQIDRIFDNLTRALSAEPETRGSAKNNTLRKKFGGLVQAHTKVCARKISGYFVEQRGRVLARYEAERGLGARAELDPLLAKILPVVEENELLVKRLLGTWTEGLKAGWELAGEQTGRENPFEIADLNIQAALKGRKVQGSKMNETTREDLRKVIKEGIEAGESSIQLGDRIADYYAKQIGENTARPMTAARTQMAGIVNDGQMAAAREAGSLMKIWIHGAPQEAREAHVAAEARYADGIPLDDDFVINGEHFDAPGDAEADVSETANCTCMVGFREVKHD